MRVVLRGKFKALRAYIERERDRETARERDREREKEW